jgi:hypothetical protein
MAAVVVTREDMERLGAKLNALADTLDLPQRALLLATLQLANEALSARQGTAADDEVSAFALPGVQSGGLAVTMPGTPPPPSAFLGGPAGSIVSGLDPQSGPTGRRVHMPVTSVTIVDVAAFT